MAGTGSTTRTKRSGHDLLVIYLNDHLAGATGGVELARRVAGAHHGLEELEMLRLGVEGKATGWRTLRVLAETDKRLNPGRLDELIARARRQADLLEELGTHAAGQVIGLAATAGGS